MTEQSTGRALSPQAEFHQQLERQKMQFLAGLPKHIPVDRFMRVVQTAVNGNPDLLLADRRSLLEAAMKAAQDGLLPDGREGALVVYNTKIKVDGKDVWIKKVQWMPMILGVMKKVRNSGEIVATATRIVYAGDKFRTWIDDDGQHIEFESNPEHDEDVVRGAFAMAKTKDGEVMVEYMTVAQVEKVRAVSRAKDSGPWAQWWEEMARKTVFRRLAKSLPMSTDADDLMRRDDELYDFRPNPSQVAGKAADQFTSLTQSPLNDEDEGPRRLAQGAGPMDAEDDRDEPEREPVAREEPAPSRKRAARAAAEPTREETPTPADDGLPEQREAEETGPKEPKPPANASEYLAHLGNWLEAEETVEGVRERWKSERKMRSTLLPEAIDLETAEKMRDGRMAQIQEG